jgi:hypothetical protein
MDTRMPNYIMHRKCPADFSAADTVQPAVLGHDQRLSSLLSQLVRKRHFLPMRFPNIGRAAVFTDNENIDSSIMQIPPCIRQKHPDET